MTASAGNFPNFQRFDVSQLKTFKTGGRMTVPGYELDPDVGWHKKRQSGWLESGKKEGTVSLRTRTDQFGTKQKVYVVKGYEDYIGFHADNDNGEMKSYAEAAFNDVGEKNFIYKVTPPGGHITQIEYNYNNLVLKVTFRKNGRRGNECYFIGISKMLATKLLQLGERGSMTGDRHNVGIEFWKLIRIPHQKTGARYPFAYTSSFTGVNSEVSKTRNHIVISDVYLKKIKADMSEPTGKTVQAILSDEEYQKLKDLKLPFENQKKEAPAVEKSSTEKVKEESASELGKENSGVFGIGGKRWKIQDFIDFKDKIEGKEDKDAYNAFLEQQDYQGALTFLKKALYVDTVTINNKKENGAVRKETYNFPKHYAGIGDEIDYDDFQQYKENTK